MSSKVVGIVDKVSGPTCRSGPLDRDLWDLGRWGHMGIHVSQAPNRRVGEAIETKSCRCEVKTWRW
jgi:hypothetical protein